MIVLGIIEEVFVRGRIIVWGDATIASLLSILVAVPILVVWPYGTLVLAERRSGYVIILLGSLLGFKD